MLTHMTMFNILSQICKEILSMLNYCKNIISSNSITNFIKLLLEV